MASSLTFGKIALFVALLIALLYGAMWFNSAKLRQENAALKAEVTSLRQQIAAAEKSVIVQASPAPSRAPSGDRVDLPGTMPRVKIFELEYGSCILTLDEEKWRKKADPLLRRLERIAKVTPTLISVNSCPGFVSTCLMDVSRTLFKREKYEDAQSGFQMVLEHFPQHIGALEFSGDIYNAQGKHKQAREQYDKCIEQLVPQLGSSTDPFRMKDRTEERADRIVSEHIKDLREKLAKLPKQ